MLTVERRRRTSTYPLSLIRQVRICTRRSLHRMLNSKGQAISGIIANTILGVIIGSIFYDLSQDTDSLQQRSTLLYFALVINAFIPAIEVPSQPGCRLLCVLHRDDRDILRQCLEFEIAAVHVVTSSHCRRHQLPCFSSLQPRHT